MRFRFLPGILAAALVLGLVLAPAASARLEVELDVQKVSEHSVLVTLTWAARIEADRDWEGCELVISFRDLRDREIYRITRTLSLRNGLNEVTGHEICESSVWERTRKFAGKLNCGF
ncbi:MAG: hypothetical protein K9M82_09935 [Deltaproteobacteria bacterium]|nr:hypothetical protein [Deltaproteobacteria bacterium]